MPASPSYQFRDGELGKLLLYIPAEERSHYTSDAFGAEAAAFIEQYRDVPWFVYLPFNAVHDSPASARGLTPHDATETYQARFPISPMKTPHVCRN